MKTFLAQNEFISNSGAHVPEAPESAAAIACPQPRAAAAPVSDGVGAKPILAFMPSEAATVSGRAPVAATFTPDGQDVPARMQGSNDCGLARDDVKPGDTMQESRPAHPATATSGTLAHNAITQAVEIRTGSIVSCEPNLPAVSNSPAQETAGLSDLGHLLIHYASQKHPDEDEVLYLLLKLHDKPGTPDLPYIPDEHAFLSEIESPFLHFLLSKKSAPRPRAGDHVWDDLAPLFLQTAR